jgi:hypothetical protein
MGGTVSFPFKKYGDVPLGDTLYNRIGFLMKINDRVSPNGTSPIVMI